VLTELVSDIVVDEGSISTSVETPQGQGAPSNSIVSEDEPEPPVVTRRAKKGTEPKISSTRHRKNPEDHQFISGGTASAVHTSTQLPRIRKENKESTSWRWDVEQKDITVANLRTFFKRTVDLFAYHALSIAKKHIGHDAKRKTIRLNIESLWTSLSGEEHEKWFGSFRKLQDGELDMLERAASRSVSVSEGVESATPAPGTVVKREVDSGGIPTEGICHSAAPSPSRCLSKITRETVNTPNQTT
jgi:hypothetical protein